MLDYLVVWFFVIITKGLPRAKVKPTWYSAVLGTAHPKEGYGGIAPPANRMWTMRREAFIGVKR